MIWPVEAAAAARLSASRIEALSAHPDCFESSPEEADEQSDAVYAQLAGSDHIIGCFDSQDEFRGWLRWRSENDVRSLNGDLVGRLYKARIPGNGRCGSARDENDQLCLPLPFRGGAGGGVLP
ncbi:hypothetical protein SP5_045_00170, partial [Sphingomonas parapaucimobilis NBRC 15100]